MPIEEGSSQQLLHIRATPETSWLQTTIILSFLIIPLGQEFGKGLSWSILVWGLSWGCSQMVAEGAGAPENLSGISLSSCSLRAVPCGL